MIMLARKTPTPDKAFCATAPPSSIAHLVGRIHRHGDVHTGQEAQERSAGAETYMQPRCVSGVSDVEERRVARSAHWLRTTRDQPLCSTQPTGMRTVPRLANGSPMDLLFAIQDDVLKQKEQEAVNYFSHVQELREIILTTRPARDVVATLKVRCISAERLNGCRGNRVTGIDSMGCVDWERRVRELRDIVAITVWDDSTAFRQRNIDFRPGAVYVLHQVDYLGFHDGIANGTVHYEVNNAYKIREVSPPLSKLK
ncbi:hypothetical protein PF001_g9328 [Phytophthora fragariae]|uniref:Uncharacterized protein n=2 Tax=Phytophthora fragariae TaxID=53985 RepID=A0A6A4E253_9STRA|nr:hypothetical protein PF001_g9328 [Phytophthora fragariae]